MRAPSDVPRVLIVSVNPLSSTSNNGKTIASFFSGYPKESIAQLYFHREVPTAEVCDNYYRVSDEDLLRALVRVSAPAGRRVVAADVPERVIPQAANDIIKRSVAARVLRSLLWRRVVTFDHPNIKDWLDEFSPEVIFFCGGNANYLYSKVHRVADRHGAEVVYYITDDYVLPVRTANPVRAIDRAWTRRCFRSMCERSVLVLTIGEKMSRTYEARFGVKSRTIMNLTDVPSDLPASVTPSGGPVIFSYVGSLHSNRWRVLVRMSAGIERLRSRGLHAELRVYSAETPSSAVMARLEASPSTRHCGSLDADGVRGVIQESDVLVHVEADDAKSKSVTSLSISTKIPEYMAAGRPIFAVGPADVASIEYLKETASAFVVDNPSSTDLDDQLARAVQDTAQRDAYAKQAWLVARENHDRATLAPRLQAEIAALVPRGPQQIGGAGR